MLLQETKYGQIGYPGITQKTADGKCEDDFIRDTKSSELLTAFNRAVTDVEEARKAIVSWHPFTHWRKPHGYVPQKQVRSVSSQRLQELCIKRITVNVYQNGHTQMYFLIR